MALQLGLEFDEIFHIDLNHRNPQTRFIIKHQIGKIQFKYFQDF